MQPIRLAVYTICFCLLLSTTTAQPPTISFLTQDLTGVTSPVDLVNANDGSDRMFIVQQDGIVRLWNRATDVAPGVFLNMGPTGLNRISTGGERGLLSMVFHPGYNGTTNRFFFVYFTNTSGAIQVARFQTTNGDPNTADGSTFVSIITISHPDYSNHNGGKLNFGPDGYLYFATGDGGGSNDPGENAQDGASLLGKMIRIDIDGTSTYGNYAIPPDNPFVGSATIDERIYALGLRNPFRWSFDRANGNMWIGDVGQSAREEIDFFAAGSTAGVNYGWPCFEGKIANPSPDISCTPASHVLPVFDYLNPAQGRAVTGGYVYRGPDYPAFRGYYIAADYLSSNVFIVWPNGSGGWNSNVQTGSLNIPAFGEAEDGTLYAVGNNQVYQVVAVGGTVLPVRLISFNVRKLSGQNELKWVTGLEQNTSVFHIEYSIDGRTFSRAGDVPASRIELGSSYTYIHQISETRNLYYRLAIQDDDGSLQYSSIIQVPGDQTAGKIYPTIIRDNKVNIVSTEPALQLHLVNSSGARVFTKQLEGFVGTSNVMLPSLPKGVYIATVITKTGMMRAKIMIE